jgi:carbonic anhydrase
MCPFIQVLISGIAGGLVVGFLSNSQFSVSGPSAAIISIILSALAQLQHFEAVLLAIFIAGIFQLIEGYKKCGFFADYIPNNIIQGMLSAIGILLILKQIPVAFTLYKTFGEL